MNAQRPQTQKRIDLSCVVTVEHTMESLEAHVELEGDVAPEIADKVLVHGAPIQVPYGERLSVRRDATLYRANLLQKIWVRIKSQFLLTELYEVSFSSGRV